MDWLKDKKNQPIIVTVLSVIIVGVLIFFLRPVIFGNKANDTAAQTSPDMTAQPAADPNAAGPTPGPTTTPGAPATPDASATAQPTQTAQASSGATPMMAWRSDPFLPVGYKPPKKRIVRKVPIVDFPFPSVLLPRVEHSTVDYQEAQQPIRRMAGLLLNKRVYAIIETNGSTEIVQPGQELKDHLARVVKIEQDKVILKTTDKRPRYIVVRMASSPRTDIGAGASSGQSTPGGAGTIPPMPRGARTRPTM
ncbi:MAG: hypothetical protein ABFD83_05780 [Armatimonadota bacterium]